MTFTENEEDTYSVTFMISEKDMEDYTPYYKYNVDATKGKATVTDQFAFTE